MTYILASSFCATSVQWFRSSDRKIARLVAFYAVYTRHSTDCPRVDDGNWERCKCPKWVWGTLNGEFVRQSAKTRSWEHAEELRRTIRSPNPSRSGMAFMETGQSIRWEHINLTGDYVW